MTKHPLRPILGTVKIKKTRCNNQAVFLQSASSNGSGLAWANEADRAAPQARQRGQKLVILSAKEEYPRRGMYG
ncbi:MAG: hypothetical protein ACJ8DI_34520 [Ktedonobacteraceae bacterium]